jgi:hypothetical protein
VIRSLRIGNFKSFSREEHIRLAPITLIFGANSAGKTTALQSLLLLLQTLENDDAPGVLLSPKGAFVDLGGFREFVHDHDLDRTFTMLVEVDAPAPHAQQGSAPSARDRAFSDVARELGTLGLRFAFGFDQRQRTVALSQLDVFVGGAGGEPLATFTRDQRGFRAEDQAAAPGPPSGRLSPQTMRLAQVDWSHPYWAAVHARSGRHDAKALREFYDLLTSMRSPSPKARARAHAETLTAYQRYMRQAERNPQLLGLRDPIALAESISANELARRRKRYAVYTLRKAVEDFRAENRDAAIGLRNFLPSELPLRRDPSIHAVVTGGERLYDIPALATFIAGVIRQELMQIVYLGPLREYPERHYIVSGAHTTQVGKSGKLLPDVLLSNQGLVAELNTELQSFGIPYELRVSAVVDDPTLEDVFAMRLVDRSGVNVSIRDVGFGISQSLPVIAQSMLSSQALICIEQPEIHLHPRLQAELAELFVRCTEPPRSNAFLIETHSEHMMLRLQRMIREGRLDPLQVSVVYVDSGGESTRAIPLRLDREGDFIDPWPEGFFEEGFRELFGALG